MKLKYGDWVEVVKHRPFYNGSRGTIIAYDDVDNTYAVRLNFGNYHDFYSCNLKKLKLPKENKKNEKSGN